MVQDISLEDVLRIADERADVREKVFGKVVDYSYSDDKIQYFTILPGTEEIYYILKNYVVNMIYKEIYEHNKVEIKLEKAAEPPFYKRKVTYKNKYSSLGKQHREIMMILMRLYISFKGIGREQAFGLLQSMNVQPEPGGFREMMRLRR